MPTYECLDLPHLQNSCRNPRMKSQAGNSVPQCSSSPGIERIQIAWKDGRDLEIHEEQGFGSTLI